MLNCPLADTYLQHDNLAETPISTMSNPKNGSAYGAPAGDTDFRKTWDLDEAMMIDVDIAPSFVYSGGGAIRRVDQAKAPRNSVGNNDGTMSESCATPVAAWV